MTLIIERATLETDYIESARLLTENEPWKSFGRTFEYSLEKVKNTSSVLYVAKENNKVIGCLLLEPNGAISPAIRALCIDETTRGKSVGSALLSHVENEIFEVKSNIFLLVTDTNYKAQQFYLKNGYNIIGVINDYVVKGKSEYLLRKTVGIK